MSSYNSKLWNILAYIILAIIFLAFLPTLSQFINQSWIEAKTGFVDGFAGR